MLALGYVPERRMLLSAGLDHTLVMWDVNNMAHITVSTNREHPASIYSLAVNSTGNVCVTGSSDKVRRQRKRRTKKRKKKKRKKRRRRRRRRRKEKQKKKKERKKKQEEWI